MFVTSLTINFKQKCIVQLDISQLEKRLEALYGRKLLQHKPCCLATLFPGSSRRSKWWPEKNLANSRSRVSKNIGDFDCFKWQQGLWLANLWSHDLLFARVFSVQPFWTLRRPWGQCCVVQQLFSKSSKFLIFQFCHKTLQLHISNLTNFKVVHTVYFWHSSSYRRPTTFTNEPTQLISV